MEDSFGKILFFPPSPFLSCHSLWMVVQRGGWWDGFDLHAPYGAIVYSFRFFKPDSTMCRTVLLTTERNMNEYPHSIDETPKFIGNPSFAPIEHYIRRVVAYLARLQSVTQSSAKGLTLKVYVKLDTKEWLRMYSRLYHACELTTCMHPAGPGHAYSCSIGERHW